MILPVASGEEASRIGQQKVLKGAQAASGTHSWMRGWATPGGSGELSVPQDRPPSTSPKGYSHLHRLFTASSNQIIDIFNILLKIFLVS